MFIKRKQAIFDDALDDCRATARGATADDRRILLSQFL